MLDIPRFLTVAYDNRLRRPDMTLVLLHGIGSRGEMWRQLRAQLEPYNVRVIAFDLLGFGGSPKPKRASYSLRQHARAVSLSMLRAGVVGRVVFVGHSLGSLVAIECAKRYPWMVQRLVLCSPPIYRSSLERTSTLMSAEQVLTDAYARIHDSATAQPERFVSLAQTAARTGLTTPTLQIRPETLYSYLSALQNSIVAQTTYRDIQKLTCPIDIIYGRMDPLVIPANYRRLRRLNPHIKLYPVMGFHEISRAYFKPIIHAALQIKQ